MYTLEKRLLSQIKLSNWHPTPVLLPGKSHERRSLVGCSPWGREESDTTERLHFHFSLSCIGEGNGNPLHCSCPENPRDRDSPSPSPSIIYICNYFHTYIFMFMIKFLMLYDFIIYNFTVPWLCF